MATAPNYPYVEMRGKGLQITYVNGERKEEVAEQTFFHRVTGDEDEIEHVQRARFNKGFAVVSYGNFPAEEKMSLGFRRLKHQLDMLLHSPEQKLQAQNERARRST